MTDQPIGRPDNTGAGDNYDPDVHDPDVSTPEPVSESTASAGTDGHIDGAEPDEAERASEVDDLTEGMARPPSAEDADVVDGTDDVDMEQALADAVNAIDLSEIDVFAVLEERDQFKTMAQRVQADFDNFRKQSAVRAQADVDRASGRMAEALLPVLDAAEAAYLRHPEEIGPLLNQMLVELKRQGLETLDLDGQPFDPEVAEAVAHEPGDGGEPIVAEVMRSGYRWKGKTLRPAMVKTTD